MVEIKTKNVGEVKDVFKKESEVVKNLEDRNEDYIKINMGRCWI